MSISITNTAATIAVQNLRRNQANVQSSLERLSTGFRINSGKDDPAGLIASEFLRSEIASTNAAIGNAQRADQVLATAEGGLSEVSNLLISLQGLVTASANTAGLSGEEIDANQLQVDSIINSIDRITRTTSFGGMPLLNGDFAYQTSGGLNANGLLNLQINAANVPAGGETIQVQVMASAVHGTLIAHGQAGGLSSAVTITLAGNKGSVTISFASGTRASAMAFSINQFSNTTGVTASANGTDVGLSTMGYGASQYVSVQSNSAAFATQSVGGIGATRAIGGDAVVTLNGQKTSADGVKVSSQANGTSLAFQLAPGLNHAGSSAQFAITGGGATFMIDSQISTAGALSIGLGGLGSGQLGAEVDMASGTVSTLHDMLSNGSASLRSGHLELAQRIVHNAITSVAQTRGRIGATRAFDIQSTINALGVKVENLSSAESQIRDTDFAAETAALARNQILAQSSQVALSAANQSQKIILNLLGA